nr:hypothetical protein BaRGS_029138 [Batillaria attramentaria]
MAEFLYRQCSVSLAIRTAVTHAIKGVNGSGLNGKSISLAYRSANGLRKIHKGIGDPVNRANRSTFFRLNETLVSKSNRRLNQPTAINFSRRLISQPADNSSNKRVIDHPTANNSNRRLTSQPAANSSPNTGLTNKPTANNSNAIMGLINQSSSVIYVMYVTVNFSDVNVSLCRVTVDVRDIVAIRQVNATIIFSLLLERKASISDRLV